MVDYLDMEDAIVRNAGIAGYTISDEQSLFIDRARYVNLDIVILQVNSNNLTDFFSFRRNEINRDHKGDVLGPSPPEIQFIETVRRVAS